MKIKISKAQWERIGQESGFIKLAVNNPQRVAYWLHKIQTNAEFINELPEDLKNDPTISKAIEEINPTVGTESPVVEQQPITVASIKSIKDLYK